MEDQASLHRFGTPLDPLDEETALKEKPKYVEDEIVTDENGRRRFHGAFTGGFSAGYWNTVGSQEGWVPKSFKSSRSEKAGRIEQKPSDFMDDEDLGEFGIAPTTFEVRKEFGGGEEERGTKRKLQQPSSTISSDTIDLLQKLFKPIQNTVGVEILKSWGWKPGQGVGPRQTKKEKKLAAEYNKRQMYIMQKYGCSTSGDTDTGNKDESESSDDDEENDEITFAPDDFEQYIANPKLDKFGIGYSGLSRDPVLSNDKSKADQHFNLFTPLEIMGKNNKKLSITGQAFGVGALEEEDEDIYEREDMSKYDFSLEDKKDKDKKKKKSDKHVQDLTVLEGFVPAKEDESLHNTATYDVELPKGYKPRNWAVRKSRFSPIDEKQLQAIERNRARTSRKADLTPEERGRLLDEQSTSNASTEVVEEKNDAVLIEPSSTNERVKEKPKSYLEKVNEKYKSREDKTKELLERISAKTFGFVRGGIIATDGKEKGTEGESTGASKEMDSSNLSGSFKPFQYDEAKQTRYDKFIEADVSEEKDIQAFLSSVQPVHMSEWDREMEKKEFIQAKKLYKPLQGIMANRFVSEATVVEEAPKKEIVKDTERTVTVVRTKTMWKPSSHLCKRYNIADPFGGTCDDEKTQRQSFNKSTKLSVFDYLEGSMNTKSNFVTPVIIPKHMHQPQEIVKNALAAKNAESKEKVSSNEKFSIEPSTSRTTDSHGSKEEAQKPNEELEKKTPTDQGESRKEEEIAPPTEALRRLTFVPKTELEKRVVESQDLPPSEKKELFKAIFDDSDDDENQDEESKIEETPQFVEPPPKPSVPINILRNTSPPRGIFAALFTVNSKDNEKNTPTMDEKKDEVEYEPPPKIKFQPKDKRIEHTLDESKAPGAESAENIYGPAIPTNLQLRVEAKTSTVDAESLSMASISGAQRKKYKGVEIIEEWVEKKEVSSSDESEDSDSSNSSRERKPKKSKKSKKSSSKKEKKSKKKKKKKSKSSKHKKREI